MKKDRGRPIGLPWNSIVYFCDILPKERAGGFYSHFTQASIKYNNIIGKEITKVELDQIV